MRVRIKFSKNESVKYIGHLDIMRSFQRFFNRANVKMIYSEGFSPHQKMHFALPLGLGIVSKGEYLDAEISDGQDLEKIKEDLNRVSGDGFDITDIRALADNADKAMASVRYASFDIRLNSSRDLKIEDYLSGGSVIIRKKTKTGFHDVDIKHLIVNISQDNDIISILMKCGSESNIKPELIIEDLFKYNGLEYSRDMVHITRNELYGPGITPLIDYQTVR